MKARSLLSCAAAAAMLLTGCHKQTPAEKARAVDAEAHTLMLNGRYGEAITLYTKAIQDDGTNGAVYFHRGTARMLDSAASAAGELGDPGTQALNDAISDFTMAIRLDPAAQASAYRARGDAKHLKGDEAGAKDDWERGNAAAH